MRSLRVLIVGLLCAAAPAIVRAEPVLIDFESLADGEDINAQFADFSFAGAIALSSGAIGGSLNESDFPPSSGFTVAAGFRTMTIEFLRPATIFRGNFTYNGSLTLQAYSGAALLGSTASLFAANFASNADGNAPNELVTLDSALLGGTITSIVITADGFGDFVLDDLFADLEVEPPSQSVPEPSTVALMLLGSTLLVARRRHARRR
jgi:hypothetical protein